MPIYVSIPSEIEATQWNGQKLDSVYMDCFGRFYVITIADQEVYITLSDYICTEPENNTRHYPCKASVFEKRWRLKNGKCDSGSNETGSGTLHEKLP